MAISFIEGRIGKGIRLNGHDLFIPVGLESNYSIYLYRKLETESIWEQVIKLSNSDTYINGTLNNSYNTSWITIDENGDLTIKSAAEDIDELMIVKEVITVTKINEWGNIPRPFYDVKKQYGKTVPDSVDMEVL